jgi:hypothetical protein
MGQVLQAGTGQITARQAAIATGVPQQVPAITLNKVCLSSLTAVALADQLIRAGEIEVAVAGGMESMTNAPYVVPGARWGLRMGPAELVDTMIHDGLWSTFSAGRILDPVNARPGISADQTPGRPAPCSAGAAWAAGSSPPVSASGGSRGRDARGRVRRASARRPPTSPWPSSAGVHPGRDHTARNASALGGGRRGGDERRRAKALGVGHSQILAHGMCADRFAYLHCSGDSAGRR